MQEFLRSVFSDKDLIEHLSELGGVRKIQPGEHLIQVGSYIKFVPIVISGKIKISRIGKEGEELFLYHLLEKQTCSVSLQCCKANAPSSVNATATENTELVVIPMEAIENLQAQFGEWREFIQQTYALRFQDLLDVIDGIAFHHLDERLWNYLKAWKQENQESVMHRSHSEIAADLNSSREVVSRLLKQLEKKGLVRLSRNKIVLK